MSRLLLLGRIFFFFFFWCLGGDVGWVRADERRRTDIERTKTRRMN